MTDERIQVLFEDRSIIVIQKQAGIATQSANVTQPDCVSLIKEHIRKNDPQSTKEPYVGVIHRLDQPVAGILVFAKDQKAAAALSADVANRMLNKHYRAVVEGVVEADEKTLLCNMMYKDSRAGRAIIADNAPSGTKLQEAKLYYKTISIDKEKNMTQLSIDLVTGRFHQIRAQLSNLGHPIAGDVKYGSAVPYPKGIALVADRLEFVHPVTGDKIEKIVSIT